MTVFPNPARIALLVCGGLGPLAEKHGDYERFFRELLISSNPRKDSTTFSMDPYDVVNKMEYPSEEHLDAYDALLLTGSVSSAYMDLPWIRKLVQFVAHVAKSKTHIKIIGICYGHQIIALALGGECVPNHGRWEIGPTLMDLTDLGQQIFGVPSLNIQQMHRDHVPTVPAGFHLLGSTSITPNQGMVRFLNEPSPASDASSVIRAIQIFTLQGHPEFLEPFVTDTIKLRTSTGSINEETYLDSMKRQFGRNDGVSIIGPVIWRMLGVAS